MSLPALAFVGRINGSYACELRLLGGLDAMHVNLSGTPPSQKKKKLRTYYKITNQKKDIR